MIHQRWISVLAVSVLLLTSCGSDNGGDGPVALSTDNAAVWDLVWFSDSTGYDVADLWAASLEREFGVEVVSHDYAVGGLSAAQILEWLGDEDGNLPNMQDQVAEAEIIVLFGNPDSLGQPQTSARACRRRRRHVNLRLGTVKKTGNRTRAF